MMRNIIREKRKERGTVNAIANAKYAPTLALAFSLAKELRTTVDELFISL